MSGIERRRRTDFEFENHGFVVMSWQNLDVALVYVEVLLNEKFDGIFVCLCIGSEEEFVEN